ncbi:MAG: LysR substrate-binding domain-containing protein [Gammaproteobacteria bacterium]|nr:LysR substrate-binding domain-containing protein [Gammaproteobacteria bacterium]
MIQKWLEAFHTVAATGGFTRAAEALNVGQPTISTHVKSLEDYFRVELFHRRGRNVKLTPTGEALFTITRGLYGHQEEALALLRATRDLETGQIALNAVGPFDVMEILQVFRREHPGIATKVTLGFEGEILNGLSDFDYDIGLLGRPVDDPAFCCEFYNRHRVLVIVHAQHPLARRRNIRLQELQGCDMVLRPPFSTTRQAFDRALADAGVSVNPIMEINSREAAREAVVRGFGAGVISETELAPSPDIHVLRVSDVEMHTSAFLVCLAERRDRPLIDAYFRTATSIEPKQRGLL